MNTLEDSRLQPLAVQTQTIELLLKMVIHDITTSTHSDKDAVAFELQQAEDRLVLRYTPSTDKAIYDICDFEGRIISTGKIEDQQTAICGARLVAGKAYLMCVLDGDKIMKERFLITAS